MTGVVQETELPVGIGALPQFVRQAVSAVPNATAVEIRADGAILGRRTNLAFFVQTTVLSFHAMSRSSTRVDVESAARGFLGGMSRQGAPGEAPYTAKAVIAELQRLADTNAG